VHEWNALDPISIMVEGNVTDVSPAHEANAPSPILVTVYSTSHGVPELYRVLPGTVTSPVNGFLLFLTRAQVLSAWLMMSYLNPSYSNADTHIANASMSMAATACLNLENCFIDVMWLNLNICLDR